MSCSQGTNILVLNHNERAEPFQGSGTLPIDIQEVLAQKIIIGCHSLDIVYSQTTKMVLMQTHNQALAEALHDARMTGSEFPDALHHLGLILQENFQLLHRSYYKFLYSGKIQASYQHFTGKIVEWRIWIRQFCV